MYSVSQHEQLQYSSSITLFTLASEETMQTPRSQATAAAAAAVSGLNVVYVCAGFLQPSLWICRCRSAQA